MSCRCGHTVRRWQCLLLNYIGIQESKVFNGVLSGLKGIKLRGSVTGWSHGDVAVVVVCCSGTLNRKRDNEIHLRLTFIQTADFGLLVLLVSFQGRINKSSQLSSWPIGCILLLMAPSHLNLFVSESYRCRMNSFLPSDLSLPPFIQSVSASSSLSAVLRKSGPGHQDVS